MPVFPYMTELVPKSITLTDGKILLSDQAIVDKLKKQNPPLFLRIVDFYAQLKIANQRTSEGKETCNVKVRWENAGKSYCTSGWMSSNKIFIINNKCK